MTEREKIALLEEIMELDENTLSLEDDLESFPEWDSISALSFIAMMDETFNKTITGQEVKELKKVSDAIKIMEK